MRYHLAFSTVTITKFRGSIKQVLKECDYYCPSIPFLIPKSLKIKSPHQKPRPSTESRHITLCIAFPSKPGVSPVYPQDLAAKIRKKTGSEANFEVPVVDLLEVYWLVERRGGGAVLSLLDIVSAGETG
jgi:hypothetical protein